MYVYTYQPLPLTKLQITKCSQHHPPQLAACDWLQRPNDMVRLQSLCLRTIKFTDVGKDTESTVVK
jgi:hypothetical protein